MPTFLWKFFKNYLTGNGMLLYSTNFHVGKEEKSIKGNLTFFISKNDLIILRSG